MKKAFTLIELLVVIAIIAILAAILFPVFAQAKAAAKASANLSNLKQDGLAVIQYGSDSDDVFPLAVRIETPANQASTYGDTSLTNMGTTTLQGGQAIPWSEAIYPYTKSRDIYTSPIEGGATTSTTTYKTSFAKEQFYGVVPSAVAIQMAIAAATPTATTYSFPGPYSQGALIDGPFGYANGVSTTNPYATSSKSQTSIDKVAEVVMVSDAGAYDMGLLAGSTLTAGTNDPTTGTPTTFTAYTPGPGWAGSKVWAGPWGRKNTSGSWNGGKSPVYTSGQRGQVTSCFTDGHASSMEISKLFELRYTDSTNTTKAAYRLFSNSTL